jgi:hypothetical protein
MRKLLNITLIILSLSSCDTRPFKHQKSDKIELRQLVKTTEISKNATASYFLILGSASYSENSETKIKLMGKVHGLYRLIEFNFNDARIKIDNSIDKPYLYLNYTSKNKVPTGYLLSQSSWYVTTYVIVCPEKYLPEQLLPIRL